MYNAQRGSAWCPMASRMRNNARDNSVNANEPAGCSSAKGQKSPTSACSFSLLPSLARLTFDCLLIHLFIETVSAPFNCQENVAEKEAPRFSSIEKLDDQLAYQSIILMLIVQCSPES